MVTVHHTRLAIDVNVCVIECDNVLYTAGKIRLDILDDYLQSNRLVSTSRVILNDVDLHPEVTDNPREMF